MKWLGLCNKSSSVIAELTAEMTVNHCSAPAGSLRPLWLNARSGLQGPVAFKAEVVSSPALLNLSAVCPWSQYSIISLITHMHFFPFSSAATTLNLSSASGSASRTFPRRLDQRKPRWSERGGFTYYRSEFMHSQETMRPFLHSSWYDKEFCCRKASGCLEHHHGYSFMTAVTCYPLCTCSAC